MLHELAHAEQARAQPEVAPWGFVVSITRGGRHRKLHHVGSCGRLPGVDYKDFEVFGDTMPENKVLGSMCQWCFGTTALPATEASDIESFASSSSSEGEAAKPAAKRRKAVVEIEE